MVQRLVVCTVHLLLVSNANNLLTCDVSRLHHVASSFYFLCPYVLCRQQHWGHMFDGFVSQLPVDALWDALEDGCARHADRSPKLQETIQRSPVGSFFSEQ